MCRYGQNTATLHRPSDLRRPSYWRHTLAIACSPLDAEQTDVMMDKHVNQQQILQTQNARH